MKIVTTDEEIARFTALMILGALDTIAGRKLSKQEFILMKDAIKKDMTLDTAYAVFEDMIAAMTDKN